MFLGDPAQADSTAGIVAGHGARVPAGEKAQVLFPAGEVEWLDLTDSEEENRRDDGSWLVDGMVEGGPRQVVGIL